MHGRVDFTYFTSNNAWNTLTTYVAKNKQLPATHRPVLLPFLRVSALEIWQTAAALHVRFLHLEEDEYINGKKIT